MSAARTITDMGADVALVDGKVKLSGLDRLPADIAERVLAVARECREELRRELSEAEAPASGTGLEWVCCPADDTAPDFDAKWAAVDLCDLCKLHGVRVVHSGERILAIYPPNLEPELIAYAGSLLAEARGYLRQHIDRLPNLPPAEAVKIILDIMRQHKGLRFCRGDGGSRWPLYPKGWTAGQRVTLQTLWFVAGDALDRAAFEGVEA